MNRTQAVSLVLALSVLLACGIEPTSAPWTPPPGAAQRKPVAPREPCSIRVEERQALFGDLHIHTGVSMDANSLGTVATPDDAYRYARGDAIDVFTGDAERGMRPAQIDRPIDFAAVTDHAE